MEINIDNNTKIVEIWLRNDEKRNIQFQESCRQIYANYRTQKYTIAVFESGTYGLSESIKNLIKQNQKLAIN